ncbi:MAG: Rrf2 family transcriptional regulator [Methylacidiphilales bacterium]|nr:Rrf2 family transcriptional regulator [Candidatus Methylacidiphilales bacterium]
MLSKRAKYGIRALVHLAQLQGKGPIQIRDISEELNIPRKFLEAILLDLRNEGILQSRKGKEGGYFMERSPDTIALSRVIRLIDGPLAAVPCVSQTAYARCDDCPDEKQCVIRWIMKEVRDSTAKILDNTTLDQLMIKAQQLSQSPPGIEYQI